MFLKGSENFSLNDLEEELANAEYDPTGPFHKTVKQIHQGVSAKRRKKKVKMFHCDILQIQLSDSLFKQELKLWMMNFVEHHW